MFHDAFLEDRAESRRPWTIGVSFLAQSLAITLAILFSLLTAGDLPAGGWVAHLLVPPPPPPAAPPPEPARATPPQEPVARFDEGALRAPVEIPDQVAAIVDPPTETAFSGPRVSGVVAVPGAAPGVVTHCFRN